MIFNWDNIPTITGLVADIVRDWEENDRPDPASVYASVETYVPSMTTVLFAMAVKDNSVAFLETPNEGDSAFTVLFDAITEEVGRRVRNEIEVRLHADEEKEEVEV